MSFWFLMCNFARVFPFAGSVSATLLLLLVVVLVLVAKIKVTLSQNAAGALYTSRCRKYGIGHMSVIQQQQQHSQRTGPTTLPTLQCWRFCPIVFSPSMLRICTDAARPVGGLRHGVDHRILLRRPGWCSHRPSRITSLRSFISFIRWKLRSGFSSSWPFLHTGVSSDGTAPTYLAD